MTILCLYNQFEQNPSIAFTMFIDDETLIHYLQGNERLRQQKQFLFFRFKIDVKRKLVAFRVCIF